ncbi:thiamine ABC transporter substrate-binding protein [Gleimia sp. 6138-11-ORH1]|uniref:thiamine ABC transporter substrate-binding protein n=1 Tax=Gleimia sp. 6138-11-ORH1 TaxID=2973937 RepID=UPI00216A7832|nr:thiamine ABC transporter substrate-binding protein [Gleimia sp. 6138-11-ORH1]MCS4484997.1 thiamine ABC transporter substrate-binding protein [Gleimia sp. 6138-11-ORH1]
MKKMISTLAVFATSVILLAACGTHPEKPTADTGKNPEKTSEVVKVLAYDSLEFTDELKAEFEKETGYKLELLQIGSGGELTNKLVLTKENPEGDVAFGIDSISAYRAIKEKVFSTESLEVSDAEKALMIADAPALIPFNQSDVCINADPAWFKAKGLEIPATLDDLKDPKYKDLLVAMNPTSSTPGLAFFMATIAKYDSGWKDYWNGLKENGVKLTKGWSDAFNTDFSAGEGKGDRPLMVSYGSSPAWAVNDQGTESAILSLPKTCFRQAEYVGALQNAKNPAGAVAFVKFMQKATTQEVFVANNYVHPVNPEAKLPEPLAKFGKLADKPFTLDAKTISENQAKWLEEWSELMVK